MQSRLDEIHEANAEVIAICVDSVEENAAIVSKLKLEFPILSDPDLEAIKAFGLLHESAATSKGRADLARPGVFIIDSRGIVRWRFLTDNWRVRVRPETILKQLADTP